MVSSRYGYFKFLYANYFFPNNCDLNFKCSLSSSYSVDVRMHITSNYIISFWHTDLVILATVQITISIDRSLLEEAKRAHFRHFLC